VRGVRFRRTCRSIATPAPAISPSTAAVSRSYCSLSSRPAAPRPFDTRLRPLERGPVVVAITHILRGICCRIQVAVIQIIHIIHIIHIIKIIEIVVERFQIIVIAAVIIGLFAVFTGSDNPNSQAYLQLYGLMAVMGVIIILSVQAVVSLSVLVYYERFHRDEVNWWKTRLAPLISFFSQAFVVYLLFTNITFLGGGFSYANWLGPIDAVVVIAGVGAAFYFKRYKPAKYEQAGRLINEGL